VQFLKALFWFLILGVIAAFAVTNWHPVEIQLWSGLVADVNLPFLILLAFLIGLLPMLLLYHAARWRARQRIAMLERTLADLRAVQATPPPAEPTSPIEPIAPPPSPPPPPPPPAEAATPVVQP
jgi:uncharacterized integral membrane protein